VRLLMGEEGPGISPDSDDIGPLIDRRCFLLIAGIFRHGATSQAVVAGSVWELVEIEEDRGQDAPVHGPAERYMPRPPLGFKFRKLTREGEMQFLG
jgi:hypothetical protein